MQTDFEPLYHFQVQHPKKKNATTKAGRVGKLRSAN